MKITFETRTEEDNDGYYQQYVANVEMKDVVEAAVTLSATSDEMDYGDFKAGIYRDILETLTEQIGDRLDIVEMEEEFPFDFFSDDEDGGEFCCGFRPDEGNSR